MTEINENFTKLDTALKSEATAAAQGRSALQTALSGQISQLNTALQSEVTTRTQQMGTKANASTVTALSQQVSKKADASAVTALSQQLAGFIACGTVVRKTEDQDIDLGFAPKFVLIISSESAAIFFLTQAGAAYLVCKSDVSSDAGFKFFPHMALTATGFHIESGAYYFFPTAQNPAYYLAFR